MNAPPFPPYPPFPVNPGVGQRFGTWVWNGAQWVPSGNSGAIITVQVFTTVGATLTYIPAPGLITAIVECVGGGAGGGGSAQGLTFVGGGGGGGSGGYSKKFCPAALVLGGVNVVVGAGGYGGNPPGQADSLPGGATSFGALCVANGGLGGNANNSSGNLWGNGGVGAAPGIGDIALGGSPGYPGTSTTVDPTDPWINAHGGGGGAIWGGGGMEQLVPATGYSAGFNGTNPGAGGSGAVVNQASVGVLSGGSGANGICVVTEYSSGDFGDGDCGPARVTFGECGPGWTER